MADDPTPQSAEPGPSTAADEPAESLFIDDSEEDLWGSGDAAPSVPFSRSAVIVGVVVLVVLVIGFFAFSGGSDGDGEKGNTADNAGETKTTTADGKTQITSQQAPWGATELTPSTLPPGATLTGCGTWDAAFNNPPTEVADGVFIWSDFDGWHVRLAGANPATVTGSVTGQVTPTLQSEATAPGVEVKQDDAAKRLTFNLTGGEVPVGFDFSAGCKQKELTFDLTTAGTAVAVDRIRLGSKGVVKEYPLVARRTLPAPG